MRKHEEEGSMKEVRRREKERDGQTYRIVGV